MSKGDPSLFYGQNNNKLESMIAIHVNDFLSVANEQFFKDTISKIFEKFTMEKKVILLGFTCERTQKLYFFRSNTLY